MSTVFKPRRSNKGRMDQTGTTGKYANAVLGAGELFLERQQTGTTYTEGSGTSSAPVQYRMKIGDGSTKYSALGYADQTQVAKSGSSGDSNIVGNVAQNTSNGGITTTFQSLADKKVSSVTTNSSTTVTNALNTVAANNTLKDILGALKQAVNLCNNNIKVVSYDTLISWTADKVGPARESEILQRGVLKFGDILIQYFPSPINSYNDEVFISYPTAFVCPPNIYFSAQRGFPSDAKIRTSQIKYNNFCMHCYVNNVSWPVWSPDSASLPHITESGHTVCFLAIGH